MKLKILFYPMILLLISAGCRKEAEIVPDTFLPEYSLPQGNHPYDTKIMDFYNTYGCYILYKFTEKDFNWNMTNMLPYVAEQGDEAYIEPALAALDKYLFSYYSTDFLKKALPYKIILSAEIREVNFDGTLLAPANSTSSFSHFAFGHAGSSLMNMNVEELKLLKADLQKEFWTQAVSYGKITLPPAFITATNYEDVYSFNAKSYGVFTSDIPNLFEDFLGFIEVIALNSAEELEQSLFLPENDPNGKYKVKYYMLIDYYKAAYGVDLQGIAQQ